MEIISSFYDNFLIYSANVFFIVIFLLFFLIGIFFVRCIIYIFSEIKKVHIEIKGSVKRVKVKYVRVFAWMPIIRIFKLFILLDKGLLYTHRIVERIMSKIEKEVFINE